MRRKQRCYPHTLFYLAATAFGIGLIIGLICSFRLAAISASLLLIIMGIRLLTSRDEEVFMKIVVLQSPKFLSPILRLIFKIKKEQFD